MLLPFVDLQTLQDPRRYSDAQIAVAAAIACALHSARFVLAEPPRP